MQLNGPSIIPTSVKNIIIFLHGYGADGNDLIGMHRHFARRVPETAFYSPHAPFQCEMSPFGKQWFSLANYDPAKLTKEKEAEKLLLQMHEGILKAAPLLDSFIDEVLKEHNIPAEKLLITGFSQGTMMALHTALQRKEQIAGVIGFSGAFTTPTEIKPASKPPVILTHGDIDDIVPVNSMHMAKKALKTLGIEVSSHEIKGSGHGINEEALMLAIDFAEKRLVD